MSSFALSVAAFAACGSDHGAAPSSERDASTSADGASGANGDAGLSDVSDASSGGDAATDGGDGGVGTADQALLDELQRATIGYFTDFAHPVSGMARERSTSGDTTTTGGTGFGISAIVTGVSRNWMSRADAVSRLGKLVDFLGSADRFHGAFSHWINGATGKVIPFSALDDGGDLVETAYLVEGLLIARAYFDGADADETALRAKITAIVDAVEWDFYATRGDGELSWHWSPDHGFTSNLAIVGYDEALITYVLATGASGHPVSPAVYDATWFGPSYADGQSYDGYTIPLGPTHGGPLFFTHYSFLGLDPRQMQDTHAFFWSQNVNHVLANRAYCVKHADPSYLYGPELWGLTASDGPDGYGAWSPTNDVGTIAPTAALSSMPYAPYHSLQVLRHLRSALGNQIWKTYGFTDALDPARGYFDDQFLAIDEGPIVVMIENYRSGLFWKLGMGIAQMVNGLAAMGIKAPTAAPGFYLAVPDADTGQVDLVRHPDRGVYELDVNLTVAGAYTLLVEDADSHVVSSAWNGETHPAGTSVVSLGGTLAPGSYVAHLTGASLDRRLPIALH